MDEHDRIARPRIDPQTTPFTETRAFRRFGMSIDPDPTSAESLYVKAVVEEQGFDGPPHVVSRRELDQYVTAGEIELFRGVTDRRHAELFREGDFFVGRGGELDGMYAAAGPHGLTIARQYAGWSGVILRMTLKSGARVAPWSDLEDQIRIDAVELIGVPSEVAQSLYNDPGRLAAYLGYDAVRILEFPDVDDFVMLNRTALRVQRENMR